MPRSGKPKFRVGQTLVRELSGNRYLVTIKRIEKATNGHGIKGDYWHYYVTGGGCVAEHDVRPLTAREIGPRPKRSRQAGGRKGR
jgi:hypothetical protein